MNDHEFYLYSRDDTVARRVEAARDAVTSDEYAAMLRRAAEDAAALDYCPACGDVIDYCRGHGEIGDPAGAVILADHDEGNHEGCHYLSSCKWGDYA